MARANCRAQFTQADVDFLFTHASPAARTRLRSLSDMNAMWIDELLDDEHVFRQTYAHLEITRFSPHFFFYLGTRWCLRAYRLDDREVADYIASVLCEFLRVEDLYRTSLTGDQFIYLVDMVDQMHQTPRSDDVFDMHTHIGDYTLFLAGMFPDYLEHRATYGRRLVTRQYYERMGQEHYHLASTHAVARTEHLGDVFTTLSREFTTIRRALTLLSVDYLVFNRTPAQRTYLSLMNDVDV